MAIDQNFWIDFVSGNLRVLDFYDYEVARANGLPSQPSFRLLTKFYMNGSVRIKSNELVITEAGALIIIDATCRLLLETTDNRHIITLNLYMQDDRRMYSYGYYFFSTYINPNDAEKLTHIINGETVRIGWRINGYAYAINPDRTFPIMPFDVSNSRDDKNRWPQISPDEFTGKIMNRLGLTEEFVIGFPLIVPTSLTSHSNLPPGINAVLTDLGTLVSNLNNAVNVLRNPRSTNDYRQVMDQVKTSVESLRSYANNLSNKKNLAKEIFLDTGVLTDIDPSGATQAAEEVIERFCGILEHVYQIASKPAHTKPRKGQPQKKFRYIPESSDAEYVLTLGLGSAKYIMTKIQAYIDSNP